MLLTLLSIAKSINSYEKNEIIEKDVYDNDSRTNNIPNLLKGKWIYGNFSMTEYWGKNLPDHIGNDFEMAITFTFNANGTYDYYFSSKTVNGSVTTHHQSVTKGTLEVNEDLKTITTHAKSAHYKQTRNGATIENRDLAESEITKTTTYNYELATEINGAKAIYLTLNGTGTVLKFFKKTGDTVVPHI